MVEALTTPLAMGGGGHSFKQVQALLNRVAVAYGAQCVVLSLDARHSAEGGWRVWSDAGRIDEERGALAWAREAGDRGAGEVMVTAIERDGTGESLDLDPTAALSESLAVPVITSCSCGMAQHFMGDYRARAAAVAAGTFFCQHNKNLMQCRLHIRNVGLPIMLEV